MIAHDSWEGKDRKNLGCGKPVKSHITPTTVGDEPLSHLVLAVLLPLPFLYHSSTIIIIIMSRRLLKERSKLEKEPLSFVQDIEIVNEDIFHWRVTILGPSESVYAGGRFVLNMAFPEQYPFKPPIVRRRRKIMEEILAVCRTWNGTDSSHVSHTFRCHSPFNP